MSYYASLDASEKRLLKNRKINAGELGRMMKLEMTKLHTNTKSPRHSSTMIKYSITHMTERNDRKHTSMDLVKT